MKTLLLIDDDNDLLTMLKRGFEKRHYSCDLANNQQEVNNYLKTKKYNYVVLDLNLNGESGIELIPHLLNNNSDISIVVTTGYASLHTAVEAIKLGATNYLSKPASIEDIESAFSGSRIKTNTTMGQQDLKTKEWEHIQQTLEKNSFNISETAKELGMHRRTLQRKLNKKQY